MARSSWTGAIDLGGFPVHIALYNRVRSTRGESFRMIAPNGGGVSQQLVDSDGEPVERAACGRGVERGGALIPLSQEALDTIGKAERSTTLEPGAFAPIDTVPLDLSTTSYAVVPDGKVAGADGPVMILWNGLLARGLAYITTITVRSGSRDGILAIYAKDDGLYAAAIPFEAEVNATPEVEWTVDPKAREVFSAFVEAQYASITGPFDHTAFESEYATRREQVLDKVLSGAEVEAPAAPAPADSTPDLLANLEAAVAEASKPKGKAKAKPKAKAKGKRVKAAA